MILDNSTEEKKVINWLRKETPTDIKFNIVTGYFTIGALYDFFQLSNEKINELNIVIGDLTLDDAKDYPIDLLNGNVSLAGAFQMPVKAKAVVEFLKDVKVNIKVLEPNFCHAKVYLAISNNSHTQGYYITGSSNLTEAGLGIRSFHNIELNIAGQPTDPQHRELSEWFNNLWNDERAKSKILDAGNKNVWVKDYLIRLIESYYKTYTPEEIYYKILFELFKNQQDDKDNPAFLKEIGRLENSRIFDALYPFQEKGVISLIKMLNKYKGAILADAVGLGKTWSALATIKYFQNKGYQTILIVPKKLHQNWQQYHQLQNSRFEEDKFDFVIRYHTDLQDERMENKHDKLKLHDFFQSDKQKLFVIDESHNLRNSKTSRYNYLVENLLNIERNSNHKVLLLSATPINTSLLDIRNQFKMLVSNKSDGFDDTFNIKNIDSVFNTAQNKFKEWREIKGSTVQSLIQMLPDAFTQLSDHLIIARTRKIITDLKFPTPKKPLNFYVTPEEIGTVDNFEELFEKFPPFMAAYSPYLYLKKKIEKVDVLKDEWQRDAFLVKMLYILLVKRLESSWYAFYLTLQKIYSKTDNIYNAVKNYEKTKKSVKIESQVDLFDEEEDEEYSIGKREIKISEIDADELLPKFKKHLKEDLSVMQQLIADLESFKTQLAKEKGKKSCDKKLEVLYDQIITKQKAGENKKVLVFTTYRDTAHYLYNELKRRGIGRIAVVTGQDSKYYKSDITHKNFETILERFCPFVKMYMDKNLNAFEKTLGRKKKAEDFVKWRKWVSEHDNKSQEKLNEEIDVLIATDCLSEGQNLQDCDFVVNYDIHWNPVRLIQRIGRIDRIGSPNKSFQVVNFWPTDNINKYLDLEDRIVDRLVAARLAGTEFNKDLIKSLTKKMVDDNTEEQQKRKLLLQMEQSVEELEDSKSFGFSDLSLDTFRQDLLAKQRADPNKLDAIPKGSFSGFIAKNKDICPKDGVIALLGFPARKKLKSNHAFKSFKLIYLDKNSQLVNDSQIQTLTALSTHIKEPRNVPDALDKRDPSEIAKYQKILVDYFTNISSEGTPEQRHEGQKTNKALKEGKKEILEAAKQEGGLDAMHDMENHELLAWMIIQ